MTWDSCNFLFSFSSHVHSISNPIPPSLKYVISVTLYVLVQVTIISHWASCLGLVLSFFCVLLSTDWGDRLVKHTSSDPPLLKTASGFQSPSVPPRFLTMASEAIA